MEEIENVICLRKNRWKRLFGFIFIEVMLGISLKNIVYWLFVDLYYKLVR